MWTEVVPCLLVQGAEQRQGLGCNGPEFGPNLSPELEDRLLDTDEGEGGKRERGGGGRRGGWLTQLSVTREPQIPSPRGSSCSVSWACCVSCAPDLQKSSTEFGSVVEP